MSVFQDEAQRKRDAESMGQMLIIASDTTAFALTCWLLGLTTQAFTKFAVTPKTDMYARAGHATAGTFLALGGAAMLCVSTRLFQAHYKEHGPRLFDK
jgi:hypothetical protein